MGITVAGCGCFTVVSAQMVVSRFAHWSVKDGLSHNAVNCILQDREGFMWFGTYDGLNKFDGHTFTVFQRDPARPTRSFLSNRINGLCEDHKNHLWATTESGGLHEIDKRTGTVTPHPIRAGKAHRWNSQQSVYEDSQGVLWICTYDGLARYEPDKHRFTLYPLPRHETQAKSVLEDRQHRLWVATTYGLYQFERQTGRFTPVLSEKADGGQPWFDAFFLDQHDVLWLGTVGQSLYRLDLNGQPLRPKPFNPGNQINPYVYLNSVQGDRQGYIWVGTTNGLQRVDPASGQVVTYRPNTDDRYGISSVNAQAVYFDRANTLWIGTDYGIDQQAERIKHFSWYQVTPNTGTVNLPENKTNALLVDNTNRLWTANHLSLYRQSTDKKRIEEIPPARFGSVETHKNYVYAMLPDTHSDDVWLGTWDALYRFRSATGQFEAYPVAVPGQLMSRDGAGNLWIGGEGGIARFDPLTRQFRLYQYNPADSAGLPDKFIYALLATRSGDVWVAVNGKGLSRLNPKTGRYTHYTAGSEPGQLNSNEVLTFYEDAQGIIWIGTNQGGLNRFDPKTGRFSHITTQEGLPTNRVVGLASDSRGRLWLSTGNGLCRFDPRTNAIRTYNMDDGLPGNDFLENAVFQRHNVLYFGSRSGVVRFNPDSIREDRRPFPVCITGFKLFDRSRPLIDSTITLAHNENFLSFEFVGLSYVLPQRSQYAYQLEGVDPKWVYNGTRRYANYTSLAPGEYTFRVRASNSDGIWNRRGMALKIRILPPWWQTWWAYLLYGLATVGAVWGFITYRSRQLVSDNRRLEEIVTIRTAEVRRQRNQLAQQRDNLEKTLSDLTDTQNQLIQKEKMASLGELTAGIAHEIQNPLNFVNNFSEVSVELVEELAQELATAQLDNTVELTSLLRDNLRKIAHHGRRADAIVKGMLQHARVSTGQRQHTNLNSLVNEYLRLAYHTIRLKDSAFEAHLDVSLADELKPISAVPQEIGRVLLNLFNNAFYSLAEKQKQLGAAYAPELTVSTRLVDKYVEVRIRDNGLGIPHNIIDKIFYPFFTTKPTGEGTGLGLSLSYDVVTKMHRGELLVDTQEGQFAEFTIRLLYE